MPRIIYDKENNKQNKIVYNKKTALVQGSSTPIMNALTLVAALDAVVPPAISVDIDDLYDNGVPSIRSTDLENLAMVVRLDKEVGNSPTGPLDLQQVDFVGPADVVKRLFTLPYQDGQPLFAVHKMGNTLLLDSVIVADTNSAMLGSGIGNHVITGNNHDMIGSDVSRHLPALDLHEMRSTISSDVSIYTPSSNQRIHNHHEPISDNTTLAAASDTINAAVTTAGTKEFSSSPFVPPPNYFMPSVPAPSKQLLSWDLHEMKLALSSDVSIYHAEEHPAFTVKTLDTTEAIELSTCLDFYLDNVMANVPELALALHTKGFIRGMKILRTEEIPFLNPLEFIESATSSSSGTYGGTSEGLPGPTNPSTASSSSSLRRNHRALQHDRMAMALSYNDEELTCRTPTDYHLDSMDSTIGRTQQSEGQGSLGGNQTATTTNNPTDHHHHNSPDIQKDHVHHSNPTTNDNTHHHQQQQQRQSPIFDPKVIDIDATTILRFLKENCRQDDGTYILRRSPDGQNLRLYDLGLASSSKQKHFKWMLGEFLLSPCILFHHVINTSPICTSHYPTRSLAKIIKYLAIHLTV